MKKQKIFCDQCGAPLVVTSYKLGVCEFCNAQYYLDGYDGPVNTNYNYNIEVNEDYLDNLYYNAWQLGNEKDRFSNQPAHAVWLDGGVSARQITPSKYSTWTYDKAEEKDKVWKSHSEKESITKKTLKSLKGRFLR